jgi:hypothetical protein
MSAGAARASDRFRHNLPTAKPRIHPFLPPSGL